MRNTRFVRLAIMAFAVVMALGVFAPAAFAGRVTRIMYAQESFDTYLYVPTSTKGLLAVTLAWGSGSPVYPVSAVNAFVQTNLGVAGDNYEDMADAELYDPTINPVTNNTRITIVQNQEYWIAVQPYVGDAIPYTLTVELLKTAGVTPTGNWYGKNGTGTAEATVLKSVSGTAYASDGEWYKDASTGMYYGVGQYWPGTMAAPITNWNLYSSDRADYVGGMWPEYTYAQSWESNTAKLYTGSGSTDGSNLTTAMLDTTGYATELDVWYCQDPQQWSCAAATNPWTGRAVPAPSADFTIYPKPMSYTWNANAPLWHTYSFTQTTRPDKPGYLWNGSALASASKRNVSSFATATGKVTWRFQGPAFSWVFIKGNRGGIARVKIAGGADLTPTGFPNPDVDQFNATPLFGQTVSYNVGGAADAWHEIEVYGTGRTNSNTTPKGYFIYHDKFVDPDDVTPDAENNYDGMTGYQWGISSVVAASGGAFVSGKESGMATAYTFQTVNATQANRKITWQYVKGNRGGTQNVYIDGQFVGTVDQFNATPVVGAAAQTTWTDGATYAGKVLSMPQNTWHTIFITGSGNSNSNTVPKGYFVYSDMFQAEGGTIVEAE